MSWLAKITGINCRNATALSDKKVHFKLNAVEHSKLYFHTLMCEGCRNYLKQAAVLDKILKEKLSQISASRHLTSNEDLKLRIIQQLNKKS